MIAQAIGSIGGQFAIGVATPQVREAEVRLHRASKWILALALVVQIPVAHAQNYIFEHGLTGGQITDAEWRTLPEYCIDTQGYKYGRGGSPNSAKWVALLGETFWHLHHYCLGIVEFNRAQRLMYDFNERRGFAESALSDFKYVIERMPEHYVLAPEIYTYLGRTYLLMGVVDMADSAFADARKEKPDYWPAYSWWAAYLSTHGQKDKARAVVAEGLLHDPGSRTLRSMKEDLGANGTGR